MKIKIIYKTKEKYVIRHKGLKSCYLSKETKLFGEKDSENQTITIFNSYYDAHKFLYNYCDNRVIELGILIPLSDTKDVL